MKEALHLLNDLGIAGPNIIHVEQIDPDPKWGPDDYAVWEMTKTQRWCTCGRLMPCPALRLFELLSDNRQTS